MPIYYFQFRKAAGIERMDGIEFPDEQTLLREAVRGAKDLMCEGICEGYDRTHWVAQVFDGKGREVLKLKFSDLLKRE